MTNYNLIRQDRDQYINKHGGGICCYIRKDIPYEVMREHISHANPDYEVLGITLNILNIKKMNLICVYRPPDGKPKLMLDHLTGR